MGNITAILKSAPHSPGIYKMKDAKGAIIYIGKAKNIAHRVRSYFQANATHSVRTKSMVGHVADIEFIETSSELEALMLETNLIKEHRPKYNILMKDDKSYVYIKVNLAEDFPRIEVVRERTAEKEGIRKGPVRYFGPKLASGKVYDTLKLIKKLFPYRHCRLNITWKGAKTMTPDERATLPIMPQKELVEVTNKVIDFPCLDYFIKRCGGPCIGAIAPEEYRKNTEHVIDFMSGKTEELENMITAQMKAAAEQKLFEKAGKLRDTLLAVQEISEKQIVSHPYREDTDIVNCATLHGHIYYTIILVRNGKMVDQENFVFDALEMSDSMGSVDLVESFESFLTQYYERAAEVPREVVIPIGLEHTEALAAWLSEKRGGVVTVTQPQKGEKNKLLELALKNATSFAKQHRVKWLAALQQAQATTRLAEVLGMKDTKLNRIEGYDISHLAGDETVGSMVVFEKGVPKSSDYRHFKVRTVLGKPDDFKSMAEVLTRRLKYLSKGEKHLGLRIAAPTKKQFEEIKEQIKKEQLTDDAMEKKHFLVAVKEKEIICFGRVHKLDAKTSIISSMWIAPAHRGERIGYLIMKKLIARAKLKRVYIDVQPQYESYYAEFGFITLHEPPAVLKEHAESADAGLRAKGKKIPPTAELLYMAYDVKKHVPDSSFSARPDLILIDGGKGQLGMVVDVLTKLQLDIPVISLAKRLEEIFVPGKPAPILLDENDEARKLLQRVRDESHRFAITFQRNLHAKSLVKITPQ